jgi:hypothetical protein
VSVSIINWSMSVSIFRFSFWFTVISIFVTITTTIDFKSKVTLDLKEHTLETDRLTCL